MHIHQAVKKALEHKLWGRYRVSSLGDGIPADEKVETMFYAVPPNEMPTEPDEVIGKIVDTLYPDLCGYLDVIAGERGLIALGVVNVSIRQDLEAYEFRATLDIRSHPASSVADDPAVCIRELYHHQVNGLNDQIRIFVLDEPGSGGAHHEYLIMWPEKVATEVGDESPQVYRTHDQNRLLVYPQCGFAALEGKITEQAWCVITGGRYTRIGFQNGPIKDAGVNGISNEALLAILIDRMEGFQSGQFSSRDNAVALTHLDTARLWLHKRTMDRVQRGVEGRSVK